MAPIAITTKLPPIPIAAPPEFENSTPQVHKCSPSVDCVTHKRVSAWPLGNLARRGAPSDVDVGRTSSRNATSGGQQPLEERAVSPQTLPKVLGRDILAARPARFELGPFGGERSR